MKKRKAKREADKFPRRHRPVQGTVREEPEFTVEQLIALLDGQNVVSARKQKPVPKPEPPLTVEELIALLDGADGQPRYEGMLLAEDLSERFERRARELSRAFGDTVVTTAVPEAEPEEYSKKRKKNAAKAAKKRRRNGAVIAAMFCVFAAVFLFSGYKIVSILVGYKKGSLEYEAISQIAIKTPESLEDGILIDPYMDIDFDALREINDDLIGWIDIPGTSISYPMVQGDDNAFYLRRTFEGEYYLGGVIFADWQCSPRFTDTNTVIYGHHMLDGTMFAPVADYYLEIGYLEENQLVHIYTEDCIFVYRIFMADKTDVTDECYIMSFSNLTEKVQWLERMFRRADATNVKESERVITLSTCTNVRQEDRFIVMAALEQEIKR